MAFDQLNVDRWWPTFVTYKKDKQTKRRKARIIPGSERKTGPAGGRLLRKENDGRFLHWNDEQKRWHEFDDLFTLYRKFQHIIFGYQNREQPTMVKLEELAR